MGIVIWTLIFQPICNIMGIPLITWFLCCRGKFEEYKDFACGLGLSLSPSASELRPTQRLEPPLPPLGTFVLRQRR